MIWLVEDPTPTLVAAALLEVVFVIILVKTGRGQVLWAIAGVAILAAVILLVELVVVTDREEIQDTLSGATRTLEANDAEAVLSYIDPAFPMRNRVAGEMQRFKIEMARVRNLQVTVDHNKNPPTATAEFTGFVKAKDLRGEFPYEALTSPFTVTLKRSGDRWLMTSYAIHSLDGAPAQRK